MAICRSPSIQDRQNGSWHLDGNIFISKRRPWYKREIIEFFKNVFSQKNMWTKSRRYIFFYANTLLVIIRLYNKLMRVKAKQQKSETFKDKIPHFLLIKAKRGCSAQIRCQKPRKVKKYFTKMIIHSVNLRHFLHLKLHFHFHHCKAQSQV